MALSKSTVQLIGYLFARNKLENMKKVIKAALLVMLCIALFLSFLFLIIGGELMRLYDSGVGDDAEAKHILLALLIGYPFSAMVSILMNAMKALNRLKMGALFAIISDYLIIFSIGWVFLKWFDAGVVGLAYGVSIGFIVKLGVFIYILKTSNFEKLHKEVMKLLESDPGSKIGVK